MNETQDDSIVVRRAGRYAFRWIFIEGCLHPSRSGELLKELEEGIGKYKRDGYAGD